MKKTSRNWTPQQDKMLEETMQNKDQGPKLKWEQIAELMHEKIVNCQKTGKQCRQRWHNHLAPQLNNSSEWTKQQNQILFQKHNDLGNKWAKIATFLKGRTDNCVKNHFYSTLRRGMRKVNNFIHEKRKLKGSIKQFKPDVLTKILIVADGDPQQKLNAKNNAKQLSKNIKQLLIKVSLETDENTYDQDAIDQVIRFIMEFNKNCKKRKGKKKASVTEKFLDPKQEQNQDEELVSSFVSESKRVESEDFEIKKEQSQLIITQNVKEKQQKQKNKKEIQKQRETEKQRQKSKQQKQNNIVQNKIIAGNILLPTKGAQDQQVQVKDQGKIFDFSASIVYDKQQGNAGKKKGKVHRTLSVQSQFADYLTNNFGGGVFGQTKEVVDQDAFDMFKNSTIGLSFAPLALEQAPSKEMFADSGVGIKKGEAFNNLSAFSERNSFLKFQGQKGVLDAEIFQNGETKRTSGIYNAFNPNIGSINGNSNPFKN